MALLSPGVQVSVIDETFGASSPQGTVPLIMIATEQNKTNQAGTGIAPGTAPENAGRVFTISSQRELLQTFGEPQFKNVQGTPVHGDETNEYGLYAAFSYLGIANRAFVVRGDVPLQELEPQSAEPTSDPAPGTYWLDLGETDFGIFKSNGASTPGLAWDKVTPTVIDDESLIEINTVPGTTQTLDYPASFVGVSGDVAVVTTTDIISMFEKISGTWYLIGTDAWQAATPTTVSGTAGATTSAGGTLDINGSTVSISAGDDEVAAAIKINNAGITDITASHGSGLEIENTAGDAIDLSNSTAQLLTDFGLTEFTKGNELFFATHTNVPADSVTGDFWIKTTNPNGGADWSVKIFNAELGQFVLVESPLYDDVQSAITALGTAIPSGNLFVEYDLDVESATQREATFQINRWNGQSTTVITGAVKGPKLSANDAVVINSVNIPVPQTGDSTNGALEALVSAINNAGITNIRASKVSVVNNAGNIRLENTLGGEIVVENGSSTNGSTWAISRGVTPGDEFLTDDGTLLVDGNTVNLLATDTATDIASKIDALTGFNAQAVTVNSREYVEVEKSSGTDIDFDDQDNGVVLNGLGLRTTESQGPVDNLGLQSNTYSNWSDLVYEASISTPSSPPEEGRLWYNTDLKVDLMVSDGQKWFGYNQFYPAADIILSASRPTTQRDGTPLEQEDIWIDTSELEEYPLIRRYNAATRRFELIDKTDQSTPFGIVFADARENVGPKPVSYPTNPGGVINDQTVPALSDNEIAMRYSDYVDPDAPDPLTYPRGMILWNMRFSTYNVKEWRPNYFDEEGEGFSFLDDDGGYVVGNDANNGFSAGQPGDSLAEITIDEFESTGRGRWVTISGNQADGAPWMGRKAQRQLVVRAMASELIENQTLRSETIFFNLISSPGYPELIDEMQTLNVDKKLWAFVVADAPLRLQPTSTAIREWATNENNVAGNGEEGLITRDPYIGLYWPWGLSTNVDGNEIVVPPSAMALRTIAFNDQVAFQWFAPAGFNRGLVTNAAAVGYLNSEEEFTPLSLSQGQRDTLFLNDINPIAFIPNRGLVVFGQNTLNPVDSALSKVNVVRLTNYLRYNLEQLAKPFLFEPNDQQTRDSARIAFERFLGDLIGLRALEDFAVVSDETNNTPARINRNELWIDVAIIPVKAVEFIFIPIRILNTGDELPS